MSLILTLFAVATLLMLAYYYAPEHRGDNPRIERFRPRESLSDHGLSHYEDRRAYIDLAAAHAHEDIDTPTDR